MWQLHVFMNESLEYYFKGKHSETRNCNEPSLKVQHTPPGGLKKCYRDTYLRPHAHTHIVIVILTQ